jgi:hypothetical protein
MNDCDVLLTLGADFHSPVLSEERRPHRSDVLHLARSNHWR